MRIFSKGDFSPCEATETKRPDDMLRFNSLTLRLDSWQRDETVVESLHSITSKKGKQKIENLL